MLSKVDVRLVIKQRNKCLSEAEREAQSAFVLSRLANHPHFKATQTVMLFSSLPDEVNTHAFIRKWAKTKRIVLPVVKGDDIMLRLFTSEEDMKTGAFGISEPTGLTFDKLDEIDLIIVPGMAFDKEGHRLGRGKGFYDRFLSQPNIMSTYKIGICLPHQLLEAIPTEAHDITMNEVIG